MSAPVLSQSLSEVAKKEKERREKNKSHGTQAQIITEDNLVEGRALEDIVVVAEDKETRTGKTPRSSTDFNEEDLENVTISSTISAHLPLQERLELFNTLKNAYKKAIEEIDEKLAKITQQLAKIEHEAASIAGSGAAGTPVAPNPNQANQTQMTGQEELALATEKQDLQRKKHELESQKSSLKSQIVEKGRRANIPASYLRF